MSNLTLYAVSRLQVTKHATRQAIVAGAVAGARRVTDRFRREQTGQDILEYSGLIVLVAGLVAVLFAINFPETVATAVGNALNAAFQNNHTYTPPKVITPPAG
jgi:hypothetical protein